MSKFEAVVGGNIANTPIGMGAKSANMSPTEIAAFNTTAEETAKGEVVTASDSGFVWETLNETAWNEPMFGQAINNHFRRVTRRANVPGGYLYSVATYGLCYVRGTANSNTSETITFVPNTGDSDSSENTTKNKTKK